MGFGQYQIAQGISSLLESLDREADLLREKRPLNQPVLQRMEDYFRTQHVYHSNAIEGNSLTLAETELVIREGLTVSGKPMKDHLEAVNLNFAINYIEELVRKKEPVNERAIKEMHQMILRQIDDENAGQYRKVSVMIGGSDFRPPEPIKVQEHMDEFMQWYETTSSEHPVVKAAKAHTWLVEIHPFVDGNGRTARLLMNLHLLMNDYPIAIIRQDERPRYYNALELSHQGDLTPFVELLIDRVRSTLNEYLRAIQEDERAREWAEGIAARGTAKQDRILLEYTKWKSQMEAFRNAFERRSSLLREKLNEESGLTVEFLPGKVISADQYQGLILKNSSCVTDFFKLNFSIKGMRELNFSFRQSWPSDVFTDLFKDDSENLGNVSLWLKMSATGGTRTYSNRSLSLPEVSINPRTGELQVLVSQPNRRVEKADPEECAEKFFDEVLEIYFGY